MPRSPLGHPEGQMVGGVWVTTDQSLDAMGLTGMGVTGPVIRQGQTFHMKLPIGATFADATVLATTPSGVRLLIEQAFYEPLTSFTGPSGASIGISSDAAGLTGAPGYLYLAGKGSILGASGGDIASALPASGPCQGTQGTIFTAVPKVAVVPGAAIIRFDRTFSAFTAGDGFVHITGRIIP
jgi:hypothetical protein